MRFVTLRFVLFRIVINNQGDIVTTQITHSRILKQDTMDSSTAASVRRGYKGLPNWGQNLMSSWVNDGETDRP
jgi:hypothetical protein